MGRNVFVFVVVKVLCLAFSALERNTMMMRVFIACFLFSAAVSGESTGDTLPPVKKQGWYYFGEDVPSLETKDLETEGGCEIDQDGSNFDDCSLKGPSFQTMDENNDKYVTLKEVKAISESESWGAEKLSTVVRIFKTYDFDEDGELSRLESLAANLPFQVFEGRKGKRSGGVISVMDLAACYADVQTMSKKTEAKKNQIADEINSSPHLKCLRQDNVECDDSVAAQIASWSKALAKAEKATEKILARDIKKIKSCLEEKADDKENRMQATRKLRRMIKLSREEEEDLELIEEEEVAPIDKELNAFMTSDAAPTESRRRVLTEVGQDDGQTGPC